VTSDTYFSCARLRKILLGLDKPGVGEKVLRALRVLKTFTAQLPDGTRLSIDVDAPPGQADSGNLAEDVTDLLVAAGEAAEARRTGVLLAIDEVQYLSEAELAALIMAVHRTTQLNLPVVLAGAGLPQLPGLAGDAKSYAERLFEFPEIGSLSREDARAALLIPAQHQGVDFTDHALELILSTTRGYPYFLQEWGYHVWNATDRSPITADDVRRVEPSVFNHLDRNFFLVRFESVVSGPRTVRRRCVSTVCRATSRRWRKLRSLSRPKSR
jgi:hypothetical protein